MKRSKMFAATLLASVLLVGAAWQGCDSPSDGDGTIKCDGDCPSSLSEALKVVCPGGGEEYSVGDKVEVTWCYGSSFSDAGVTVAVSTDGGKSWSEPLGTGQIDKPTNTMTWTVTSDAAGQNVMLMVEGYNDNTLSAQSGTFTVAE